MRSASLCVVISEIGAQKFTSILADIDGQKDWLHADRNGFLYKADRTNDKFIWGKEISKLSYPAACGGVIYLRRFDDWRWTDVRWHA